MELKFSTLDMFLRKDILLESVFLILSRDEDIARMTILTKLLPSLLRLDCQIFENLVSCVTNDGHVGEKFSPLGVFL